MTDSGYKTKQRAQILDCLKKHADTSFTVDSIVDLLKSEGVSVGRTTVYRYIDRLAENGDVRKIFLENEKSAVYQYIPHKNECMGHMHLKCVGCGRLVHLGCDFMNGVCDHIKDHHNFTVDNSKTTIFGLCGDCAKKEEGGNGAD